MFSLFKKPVTLKCYTTRADVFYNTPILKASECIPNWFKNISSKPEIEDETLMFSTNMKHCAGFRNVFSHGAVIPMWSDLNIQVGGIGNSDYRWAYSDRLSFVEEHDNSQRGDYLPSTHYQALKIVTPWHFLCDEDIDFMFTDLSWCKDKPEEYITPNGIIDFKYNTATNVNIVIPKDEKDKIITINADTPMVQIVPLSERKLVIEQHLITERELEEVLAHGHGGKFFNASYYKNKKSRAKKCPFSSK